MRIEAKNFPVFALPEVQQSAKFKELRQKFIAAKRGGKKDKYEFALEVFSLAQQSPSSQLLPGLKITAEMRQQTFKACLAVFEAVGKTDSLAAFMSSYCYAHGFGCQRNAEKAHQWADHIETLTGEPSSLTQELRHTASRPSLRMRKPFAPHYPDVG